MDKMDDIVKKAKKLGQAKLLRLLLEQGNEETKELIDSVNTLTVTEKMDTLYKLTGVHHAIKDYIPTALENLKNYIKSNQSTHSVYPDSVYTLLFSVDIDSVKLSMSNSKVTAKWKVNLFYDKYSTKLEVLLNENLFAITVKYPQQTYNEMLKRTRAHLQAEVNRFTICDIGKVLKSIDMTEDLGKVIELLKPKINRARNNSLSRQITDCLSKFKNDKEIPARTAETVLNVLDLCCQRSDTINLEDETVYILFEWSPVVLLVKKDNMYIKTSDEYPAYQRQKLAETLSK